MSKRKTYRFFVPLLLHLVALSAHAESLGELGARLGAESQKAYEASRFSALSKDYFSRFSRDPNAKPDSSEVEITGDWKIVASNQHGQLPPLMATHLAEFLTRLNVNCDVVPESNPDGTSSEIQLTIGDPAGTPDEGFALTTTKDRVIVQSSTVEGLRDGVVHLAEEMGLRQAPFVSLGERKFRPRLKVRLGTVPWMGSQRDLVFMGYNAVFVSVGDLYSGSISEAIPELAARRSPGSLERLAASVEDAAKYKLHTFCFTDIRRKFPKDDPIFQRDPSLRGALTWKADGEYVLCTEHPAMKQFLQETVAGIFKAAPELDGLVIIIGGEGFYHCYMRAFGAKKGHTTCERCEPLGAERAVANLCNNLAEAAREFNPKAEIIAWPYSAEHVWSADPNQSGFINLLKPGCGIFTEMEKDEYVEKPNGVRKHLWDYSIDLIGPGERAKAQIAACRAAGASIYMKSEPELGFEAPRLPFIPCLDRWIDRAEAMAACGADGAWVFPAFRSNYGSSAAEAYKLVWWDPAPDKNIVLDLLAARIAGNTAGPHLRKAWSYVSEAVPLMPEIPSYYKGPYYLGPAHPMCADANAELPQTFYGKYLFMAEIADSEGLKSLPTFVTKPTGNAPVFAEYYKQMQNVLAKALGEIEQATPLVPERCKLAFDSEASAIRWYYHTARTEANFYESCILRDRIAERIAKTATAKPESAELQPDFARWLMVLRDELANAKAALPVIQADMRLDFYYGGDHTFPHAEEMLRTKIAILEKEIDTYVPQLAKQCGVAI
jgi:hypothetical protein